MIDINGAAIMLLLVQCPAMSTSDSPILNGRYKIVYTILMAFMNANSDINRYGFKVYVPDVYIFFISKTFPN